MFDISFTELMVIGMIALVVIGPERLPKVARTLGHLLGRAQRYVNDVKTDIKREMEASDLNNIKNQFDEAATSVKASLDDASRTIGNPLLEAQHAIEKAGAAVVSDTSPDATPDPAPATVTPPAPVSHTSNASNTSTTGTTP